MSEPLVFISRNKIKEGKAKDFRKHYQDSIQPVFIDKPYTLAQLAYENIESNEFTIIRFFPSADALDLQLQGADERSIVSYTFIEPVSFEIYGAPNTATLEKMRKIAGSGIAVNISSNYTGGFIRNLDT
jgi:hypothetical protein